jgi:hypothetical protein
MYSITALNSRTFYNWLKLISCLSSCLFYSYSAVSQTNPANYYNTCHNCFFLVEENSLIYDNGGADGPVSNQQQTTTFKADSRRGKKISLYFREIDLPSSAYLKVMYKNVNEADYSEEIFTSIKKVANITADEIILKYFPADNPDDVSGWAGEMIVFDANLELVSNRPESDCPNAIPLCANQTVITLGGLYTNTGQINDDSGTCYSGTGAGGSVWYTFSPQTNGPLDFRLLANSSGDDYDFVLFDVTNGCNSKTQISCNYSLYGGNTGMSGTLCNENLGDNCGCSDQNKGSSCNRFNNRVNVQSNRTYALVVNFFSGSNSGFTLQFQNETGSVAITDNRPPQVANGFFSDCNNASNFTVQFTEFIQCSSISGGSFNLPGYTFTVTNTNCFEGRTKTVNFTVSPALPAGGQYNVTIQGIRDLCNNVLDVNYLIDLSNPPNPSISNPVPICRNPTPQGGFSNVPANQTITASGGTSYLWSTGANTASIQVNPGNTTTYTVTAFRGACSGTASTTVLVRRAQGVTLGSDQISCGNSVTLTATPSVFNNYQFFRNPATGPLVFNNGTSIQNGANPSITVTPTANTTYRVIVTDANGCRSQADVRVIYTTDTIATITVPANNFCTNANPVNLTASPPGGIFSGPGISGNTFRPSVAGPGSHVINYTVTNNCGTYTGTTTITVKNGSLPNFNLNPTYCVTDPEFGFTPNPRCGILSGPGIVNPGFCLIPTAYAQNPRFNPGQAGAGTHVITINYPPNTSGCSNTTTVTVLSNQLPVLDDPGGLYCSNVAPFELSATPPGGTFSGPGVNGNIFNPALAGVGQHTITYTVNGCSGVSSDFKTIEVVVSNASAIINYSGSPYCRTVSTPQPVTLTGTSGGTFSASPAGLSINTTTGAITPSTSNQGIYTVTYSVSGGGGCGNFTTTASVSITNSITPSFNPILPFCAGTTAPVLPSTSINNITGTWNPSIINNTVSATYTFNPNPGQCATSVTLNATVNPAITPVFTPIVPFCSGQTAPVLPGTSNNGVTGTWSPAIVDNTTSAAYTFTPSPGQCANQATLNITVNVRPVVTVADPNPICSGQSVVLTASGASTYSWSPAAGLSSVNGNPVTASPASTTTYTVTGTAANGCTGSDDVTVVVSPLPITSPIFRD